MLVSSVIYHENAVLLYNIYFVLKYCSFHIEDFIINLNNITFKEMVTHMLIIWT